MALFATVLKSIHSKKHPFRLKIARIGIARGDGKAASKRRKKGRDARRTEAEEWYYRYGPRAHVGGQRNGC